MKPNGSLGKQVVEGYKFLGFDISEQQAQYEGVEGALRLLWLGNLSCDTLFIRYKSESMSKHLQGKDKGLSDSVRPYRDAVKGNLLNVRCDNVIYERLTTKRRDHTALSTKLAIDAIGNRDEYFYFSF